MCGYIETRARHPSAFITLALAGILFRAVALGVTTFAVSGGMAVEANPVFYMVNPSLFVTATFASLIVLYGIFWAIPMSSTMRISLTLVVTLLSAIDMVHDIFVIEYHQDIYQYIAHLL